MSKGLFGLGRRRSEHPKSEKSSTKQIEEVVEQEVESKSNLPDYPDPTPLPPPIPENITAQEIATEPIDEEIERLLSDPTVIGYGTREEQMAVYSAVLPAGYNPANDSILDVGCGVGDLYAFLQEIRNVLEPKYTGIDYNPNMVDLAKTKFPEIGSSFNHTDLFDLKTARPDAKFDFIVAISSFNIKMHDDMISYSLNAIDDMLTLANRGIGINFISQDVEEPDPEGDFIKYDPVTVFKALVEKYPAYHVIIMNNYIEGDFAVHIYKK